MFGAQPGGTTWSQQAYVKSPNTRAGDTFGSAVALSDDSVSESGAACLY